MPPSPGGFPATRHSVMASLGSKRPEVRRGAFEVLVQAYWRAVYKYVRLKWRATADEAADLTQGFFLRAFEKRYFADFDAEKARFRTFLRLCVDRFVARERQSGARFKRGGAVQLVPLDLDEVEREFTAPAGDLADVDAFFQREWMRGLFGVAVSRLRAECAGSGHPTRFRIFERYDLAPDEADRPTYARLATEFGVPVSQVTNELAAARRDFRRLVTEALREQCATDEELQNELRAWSLR